MTGPLYVRRAVRIVDEFRVARCRRAPEFGPHIVFFSGGTALREFCRVLTQFTHNSTHIVTTFDSGGSSAALRDAFAMPSIGDLRNRLLALADESVRGNPEIYRLFAHRLPTSGGREGLHAELLELLDRRHPLMRALPTALGEIVRTHLRTFAEACPSEFDLRGASVGNLVLAAGYLDHDRSLDAVLYLFSKLVEARGHVIPVTADHLDLQATLEDGTLVEQQHLLSGKARPPIGSPVADLRLVTRDDPPRSAEAELHRHIPRALARADLIVLPMGSFYSSIIANLLPRGVGAHLAASDAPKIFVPNTGTDPEQFGMSLSDCIQRIVEYVRRDAGADTPISRIVNGVILDVDRGSYTTPLDISAAESMGPQIVQTPLTTPTSRPGIESVLLAQTLVSIA